MEHTLTKPLFIGLPNTTRFLKESKLEFHTCTGTKSALRTPYQNWKPKWNWSFVSTRLGNVIITNRTVERNLAESRQYVVHRHLGQREFIAGPPRSKRIENVDLLVCSGEILCVCLRRECVNTRSRTNFRLRSRQTAARTSSVCHSQTTRGWDGRFVRKPSARSDFDGDVTRSIVKVPIAECVKVWFLHTL